MEYIWRNNFNSSDESPCWLWVAVYCTRSAWWIVCWNVYVVFTCLRQVRVEFVCTGLPLTPSQHYTHTTHTHTHTHTCTHVCYIEPFGSDGNKIDSDSQSFWFWFTHTYTHTHTQSMVLHSYVLPAKRLWSSGWWVRFFLWRHPATHWDCHTHNLKWPVAWNVAWADRAESGSRRFASCRTVSTHQTILTITSRL